MIKLSEFMMGREKSYRPSIDLWVNAAKLLAAINFVRGVYGKALSVSSGYRPGVFNRAAGGAVGSAHETCEAIDLYDADGAFAEWCLANLEILEKAGLYLEDPTATVGWVHLQTRAPRSGKRVFLP